MTDFSINIQQTRPCLWYRTFGVINCVYAKFDDLNMAISHINQWGKSRYFYRSPSRMKTIAVVFISLPGMLYASFHYHMWIQTGVTVRKWLSGVMTSVTLTFDLWPWPFTWTSLLSMVITSENFMMTRWQEHGQKGVTDRQTDRRTDGRKQVFIELLGHS